jgi:hypothetical protein
MAIEPRIYTRNYVDADCSFTSSHGGVTANLFDRNTVSRMVTTGANNDVTIISLYINFIENGVPQTRTIDTMFLLNHNLKNWSYYSYNGATYDLLSTHTGYVGTNSIETFTPVATTGILLQCDVTQSANAEKSIGEIIFCATVNASQDLSAYDTRWREKTKDIVLGDGSIHRVVTRAVSGRNGRYEARCRYRFLTKSQRDDLKALKETGLPFLWQPESVTVPEDVFFVHWSNSWDDRYMDNFKGAGYEVSMDLKEV